VLYDRGNVGTKPIIKGPNSPPAGVEASLDIEVGQRKPFVDQRELTRAPLAVHQLCRQPRRQGGLGCCSLLYTDRLVCRPTSG